MKGSLQTKLLALCILLVLLTAGGISITYYVLTRQDKQRESRQRIQVAFEIISNDILDRIHDYSGNVEEFLQQSSILSWGLSLYHQEADKQQFFASTMNASHLTRMGGELQRFSRLVAANQLSLYGVDGRLLVSYHKEQNQEYVGAYVVTKTGQHTYLPTEDYIFLLMNQKPLPEVALPEKLVAEFAGTLPDKIVTEIVRVDQQLGIRVIASVSENEEKVGVLVGDVYFGQRLAEHYASLSHTEVNLFAGNQWSIGTLPTQVEVETEALTRFVPCEALFQKEANIDVTPVTIGEQGYYQAQCVFKNAQGTVGAITTSLSQEIEKRAIRKILISVLTISVIISGLAFGFTAAATRKPVRFIQRLITYIDRISKGDIPDPITEEYKGEFHDIKQNLNALIRTMQTTTEIALEVADGNLTIHVEERSADDWLMKALQAMVRRLTRFSNELDGLVQAVNAGDLSRRGNIAIFSGGWRDLVSGVNNVIDAFVEMTQLNESLKTENLRMGAELEVSQRIQQMVLPSSEELQQMTEVEIVGYMQPAEEVGGDYYDVLNTNGTIHMGIGDVTGHGLESGVVMLMTQVAIRTLVEQGESDPVQFFTVLNRVLKKNIERMRTDKSMTLSFANYEHGTLRIVGQHEELLIVRHEGRIERVDTIDLGFPLGLTDDIANFVAEARVALQPGDSVVLYTDGIPEAENTAGQYYGVDRLCDVLSRHWDRSAETIKQAVIDDVARHVGTHKVYDDVTLLVMKQR